MTRKKAADKKKRRKHQRDGTPTQTLSQVHGVAPDIWALQLPRPDSSGTYIVTMVPQYRPGDPRATFASPEGGAGVYRATYVLSLPG